MQLVILKDVLSLSAGSPRGAALYFMHTHTHTQTCCCVLTAASYRINVDCSSWSNINARTAARCRGQHCLGQMCWKKTTHLLIWSHYQHRTGNWWFWFFTMWWWWHLVLHGGQVFGHWKANVFAKRSSPPSLTRTNLPSQSSHLLQKMMEENHHQLQ